MVQPRNHHRHQRLIQMSCLTIVVGLVAVGSLFLILNRYPKFAALGADELRNFIGNERVAKLETAVLQAEDWLHQWRYKISNKPLTAPWGNESVASNSPTASSPGSSASNTVEKANPSKSLSSGGSKLQSSIQNLLGIPSGEWSLPSLPPMGKIAGEGTWQPYLRDPTGRVVAERTFLQPDPQRPYAVVAIVAFDLQYTRLHFVLGNTEPKSSVSIPRPGTIPSTDMAPGVLLAAFNGGFRAQDGNFGTVVNGIALLPLRDGLGTVAIYSDGTVRIGMWGTEITSQPDLVILRQNGPLMIHNGQIAPNIAENNPQDWGFTLGGVVATYRSAIGISKDGRTLYYAAGGGLTRPELADALQTAGVYQAVQMDINDYWVHFDRIQFVGHNVVADPLLPAMKKEDDQRYIQGFTRDFFYVTSAQLTTAVK